MTLDEYMESHRGRPRGPFQARPFYSRLGDFLSVYFEDADCYAETVNDGLVVYRAMDDKRVVGCKVIGVTDIQQRRGTA